ncbi:MAG: hypothetical protein ABI647_18295 [Gemmatimonadota bacterium]
MPPKNPKLSVSLPRQDRFARSSVVWAILGHIVLLFLLLRLTAASTTEYESPEGLRDPLHRIGGGGGGSVREVAMVALSAPRQPVVPPPVPVPVPIPVPVTKPVEIVKETPPVEPPPVARPDTTPATGGGSAGGQTSGPGSGTGTGGGNGSGNGPGNGSGNGPGGGEGGRARPPEPRQVIMPPPDVPKSIRGMTVAVTFLVAVDGRVDNVRFEPDLPDHGFAKKLEEVMRGYRFRPARGPDGLPIAGTTTVSVSF